MNKFPTDVFSTNKKIYLTKKEKLNIRQNRALKVFHARKELFEKSLLNVINLHITNDLMFDLIDIKNLIVSVTKEHEDNMFENLEN